MTVTVKLVTEQTTNQLVDSVNKAQADNWFPVCGVVCFNARYTQLMALDTDITTPPACDYFIVDAEDGLSFAKRVNELLATSPGAVCLSSVQYVQARYIQAYGDDALHSAGGGGGALSRWYSEALLAGFSVVPALKIDQTLPYVTIDATASQMAALAIVTGYGTSGSDVEAPLQLIGSHFNDQWQWQITGDQVHTGQIVAHDGYMMVECGGTAGNKAKMTLSSGDVDDPKGASLEAGSTRLTLLDKSGSDLTIADGQEFVIKSGTNNAVRLHSGNVELNSFGTHPDVPGKLLVQDALSMFSCGKSSVIVGHSGEHVSAPTGVFIGYDQTDRIRVLPAMSEIMQGDSRLTMNPSGLQMVNTTGTLEMDANALRVKRGANQLFSISDAGGTMTWNSVIRSAWNADGWNVSRDTGVSFTSRATLAAMMGPNDSRVEANATGLMLSSNIYNATASKLTMINASTIGNVGTSEWLNVTPTDTTINALAGNVTFNALGQSMSIGPAGLRYTVDGHDVIQSGSTTGRSAPDLTIHRPGGGNMMLDMTLDSATLTAGDDGKVELRTDGGTMVSGKDGYAYMDTNGVKIASTSGNQMWCTNGQYVQFDTTYGHIFRVNGETTLGMETAGTALSHPSDTSVWVGTKMHLHVTDAGFSFATTGASGPITERLRITSDGQITAAAGYTPIAASDLATKQYVDNASATVGTYNASGTSAVAIVPGKDVYYSSVASAGGGLTMYAPTAGKPDVTIAAPSHAAIIINAPSGVLLRRGATTANLITIPPSTHCRFVALSATEWLVLPSGGAS